MLRKEKPRRTKTKPVNMRFLRWGSSRPQKHDNGRLPSDSEDRNFHTPPTVWGFYAFPRGFVCYWLLGADAEQCRKTNRFHWIRDEHGKKVENDEKQIEETFMDNPQFSYRREKKYSKREKLLRRINKIRTQHGYFWKNTASHNGKDYLYTYGNPNYFDFSGDIWHHLEYFEYAFIVYNGYDTEKWEQRKIRLVPEEEVLDRCGSWVKTNMRTYRRVLRKYHNMIRFYGKNYWCSPKILERQKNFAIGSDWDDGVFEVYIEKI